MSVSLFSLQTHRLQPWMVLMETTRLHIMQMQCPGKPRSFATKIISEIPGTRSGKALFRSMLTGQGRFVVRYNEPLRIWPVFHVMNFFTLSKFVSLEGFLTLNMFSLDLIHLDIPTNRRIPRSTSKIIGPFEERHFQVIAFDNCLTATCSTALNPYE